MIARAYAHALRSAEEGKTEEAQERLMKRFSKTLARKGHAKLLPAIAKELDRIEEQTEGTKKGVVMVASEHDTKRYASEIEALSRAHALSEKPEVIVNDRVVGGYRFEKGNVVHDVTYRRFLIDLYRTVIS